MNGWEDVVQPLLYTVDGAHFSLLLFAALLATLFGLISSLVDGLESWRAGHRDQRARP